MRVAIWIIGRRHGPEPHDPVAGPHHLHYPAGVKAVDHDAVVVGMVGKGRPPGKFLAGEAGGIDSSFLTNIAMERRKNKFLKESSFPMQIVGTIHRLPP